jgi:hypothetical protein
MIIYEFDPARYNFHTIVQDFLDTPDLAAMTSDVEVGEGEEDFSIYKQMERSTAYERLYDRLDGPEGARFYDTFERFVRGVVRPQFDEPVLYQKKPTHRIHFRNDVGQSRFHKDTDYGHSAAEINYSVPQTAAFDTNTIWIESAEDRGDYQPIEMDVGEFARFDGATLRHGAKENDTGRTRVSFDFRVIPVSQAPDQLTDTEHWEEGEQENPLFQNAHDFARCD